jgi:hypothetical protein
MLRYKYRACLKICFIIFLSLLKLQHANIVRQFQKITGQNFSQNLSGSANFESVLTRLFFDVALYKIIWGHCDDKIDKE